MSVADGDGTAGPSAYPRPRAEGGTMPDRAPADETKRLRSTTSAMDTDLGTRPLIIASNRGPVTFSRQADGSFEARKGSGGVVTAVTAIAREHKPIWIAAAMTEGDRERAADAEEAGEALIEFGNPCEFRLRFVVPEPEAYHQYYNVISNPLLWFLQHYLWDTPRTPDITKEIWDAWRDGYVVVNELFADEIVAAAEAAGGAPLIMLQDYHLYLCAGLVRQRQPDARLQQFVHIPWPDPDYWRLLPLEIRRSICEGMLGNDIVGFQTPEHGRSFMYTCQACAPDGVLEGSAVARPLSAKPLERVHRPARRPRRAKQEHRARLSGVRSIPG